METVTLDKLAWIHIVDKRILMARSLGNDIFYVPGGRREQDETDEQTLCREIMEELSVQILPETMKYLGVFQAQAHGRPEGVFVRIICYTAHFVGTIGPRSEIEEIQWFSYRDRFRSSAADQLIFDWLKTRHLIV